MVVQQYSQTNALQVRWTYVGCDSRDERQLEAAWDPLRIELEGKIGELADAPAALRIAVEQAESPPWTIRGALHLTGGTLVSEATDEAPEAALEKAVHELAQRIDQRSKKPDVWTRREGLQSLTPILDRWRSSGSTAAFMSFIAPVIDSLVPYVNRELKVREGEGSLSGETIDPADVFNELFVEAWRQFPDRPQGLPLDLWLVRLADDAIERLARPIAEESLNEPSSPPSTDPADSERTQWVEQVSYPERADLSQFISDEEAPPHWDDLDLEAKQAHLTALLRDIPRQRRQAMVLNMAHGFALAEIADFQDRAVEDVQSDISQGASELRRNLQSEAMSDEEESFGSNRR